MGKTVQVSEKKVAYYAKISKLLRENNKGFIVCCDHVGSLQLQQIRQAVREHSTVVFGKNTLIKKAIRSLMGEIPGLEKLLPCFKWNVGFVFTQGNLKDVRDALVKNQVPAAARPGQNAQCDVVIPAQNTGLDPGQTAFFQALSIPTRISKGTIEILNDVTLLKEGDKVGNSECALLQKLNIKPFHFGLEIRFCFNDGAVFEPTVLDLDTAAVTSMVANIIQDIACIGLGSGIPNRASIPHTIAGAFKNLLAVAVEADVEMAQATQIKEAIKNPGAFAAAPATATTTTSAPAATSAPAKAEPEPEPEFDGLGGLFD